jgi:hypothetical protein
MTAETLELLPARRTAASVEEMYGRFSEWKNKSK